MRPPKEVTFAQLVVEALQARRPPGGNTAAALLPLAPRRQLALALRGQRLAWQGEVRRTRWGGSHPPPLFWMSQDFTILVLLGAGCLSLGLELAISRGGEGSWIEGASILAAGAPPACVAAFGCRPRPASQGAAGGWHGLPLMCLPRACLTSRRRLLPAHTPPMQPTPSARP